MLKSVILVIEEFPKKSRGNSHTIPYKRNPWNLTSEIKFNLENITEVGEEKLCITKIVYRDFFKKSGIVYEVSILNGNDGSVVMKNIESTVFITFNKKKSEEKTPKVI